MERAHAGRVAAEYALCAHAGLALVEHADADPAIVGSDGRRMRTREPDGDAAIAIVGRHRPRGRIQCRQLGTGIA